MDDENEKHLYEIIMAFRRMADSKYRAGKAEHGGNIWDLDPAQLVMHAMEENVDGFSYLVTILELLERKQAHDCMIPGVPGGAGGRGWVEKPTEEDRLLVQKIDCRATIENGRDCICGQELGIHAPKLPGDVGYDLVVSEDTVIPGCQNAIGGGNATKVPCNIKMKIPAGLFAQVVGRSSAANTRGILVHTATIDNAFTGQMFACCWGMGMEDVVIKRGERLGQVIFLKAYHPEIVEVKELPETKRGENGFGSTGL